MNYAAAFAVYLVYVALRALQQRHVQHAEYWRMPPVSYGMAVCDVFLVSLIARNAESVIELAFLALAMGTGSSLGSMIGTYLHVRKHPKDGG